MKSHIKKPSATCKALLLCASDVAATSCWDSWESSELRLSHKRSQQWGGFHFDKARFYFFWDFTFSPHILLRFKGLSLSVWSGHLRSHFLESNTHTVYCPRFTGEQSIAGARPSPPPSRPPPGLPTVVYTVDMPTEASPASSLNYF